MYNDSYYSRRGRTIQRKKIDNGHVINPSLVPVYYNYLKDNGMFPAPPPSPPVHVDDGKYLSFDYSSSPISYSFPSSFTSVTNVVGTLLDSLGIDVDISIVQFVRVKISFPSSIASGNNAIELGVTGDSAHVFLGPIRELAITGCVLNIYRTPNDGQFRIDASRTYSSLNDYFIFFYPWNRILGFAPVNITSVDIGCLSE